MVKPSSQEEYGKVVACSHLVALRLMHPLPDCRYRQSHNTSDWQSSYVRMQKLDEYHGQASGIFACDEHLAGKMPSRGGPLPLLRRILQALSLCYVLSTGTELCTVVESMFSFETLFEIQGDPVFGISTSLLSSYSLFHFPL